MKKPFIVSLCIAATVALLLPVWSHARSGDVLIPADENVAGDIVRVGRDVKIEAPVVGNVVSAGASVLVAGPVRGDVIVMGGEVRITADVQGSVVAVGGTVEVAGSVGGSVYAVGGRVIVQETAEVTGSVIAASSELEFRGRAGRDIRYYGEALEFGGEAGSNVHAIVREGDRIVLERTAIVHGDFNYSSYAPAQMQDGSVVSGNLNHHQLEEPSPRARVGAFALGRLVSMFSLIVVGLIFISLVPKAVEEITDREHFWRWRGAGEGIVWFVITPLVVILLLFTVIGVPLALILAASWGIAMYCAQVMTSIAVGKFVLMHILKTGDSSRFVHLLFGALAWVVATNIPVIGWAFCFVGVILGIGSMVSFKRKELARYR